MRGGLRLFGLAWPLALLLGVGAVAHAEEPQTLTGETTALGWQTYHSDGFSVSVPDTWVANAQPGQDGADVISLEAPDSTAGVTIVVQPSADSSPAVDLPNTLCQPITVGGQPAIRCLDTLSRASSISLQVSDRQYQILATERQLGTELYQAMLASFGFDQAGTNPSPDQPQPSTSTTNPQQYDCASSTGNGKAKPLCAVP
jgi:hypothetical protein